MYKRFDKSYFLLVFPILHATVPWLQYRIRSIIPFFFVFLWSLLALPKLLRYCGVRSFRLFGVAFLYMVALSFIDVFYAIFGLCDFPPYYKVAVALNQLIFFIMSYYTIATGRLKELKFITIITLIGIIVAGVAATRGLAIEGLEGARSVTGVDSSTVSTESLYDMQDTFQIGLGQYGYMYLCCWLVGPLLVAIFITKKKLYKFLFASAFIACFLCLKGGGLGTPVAVAFISFIFVITWVVTKSRGFISFLGVCTLVLFLFYATCPTIFGFLSDIFRWMGENTEVQAYRERCFSIADSFSGDKNAYAYQRAQIQLRSIQIFLDYPFLGCIVDGGGLRHRLGGHSYVFDILGKYGLFGGVILLLSLWSWWRCVKEIGVSLLGSRWLIMLIIFMCSYVFASFANPNLGIPCVFHYFIWGLAWLSIEMDVFSRSDVRGLYNEEYCRHGVRYV